MKHELDLQARLRVNRTCFGLNIQRAARIVSKKFDAEFRHLGINHWQFALLMTVYVPGGLTVGELASLIVVDRTTITANVKPLEKAGLLSVRVDDDDARVRRVELTDKGEAVLRAAYPIWDRINSDLGSTVGKGIAEDILDGLSAITSSNA